MLRLATSDQMRSLDYCAITTYMMPSTLLMTNAAGHIADAAMKHMGKDGHAAIFCGSGNNGGDGIAAAVIMALEHIKVRVFFTGSREKMTTKSV